MRLLIRSLVNSILIHGGDIASFIDLPIGMLSEEAQEARNKDYKNIRQHHTRKCSRTATTADIIHWLLLSSDPIITAISQKNKILTHAELNHEASLLLNEEVEIDQ